MKNIFNGMFETNYYNAPFRFIIIATRYSIKNYVNVFFHVSNYEYNEYNEYKSFIKI